MAGRKQWDPRDPYARLEPLEELARKYVGDGKRPNLFFVFVKNGIVLVSQDFTIAYEAWKAFSQRPYEHVTTLEDRLTGVLASVEPESDEPDARLIKIDDTGFLEER